MKKAIALFFILLVFSCQFFDKPIPNEKQLLDKQIKEINWNEVDAYPSVLDCEKLSDKQLRKQCFFEFLTTTIKEKLAIDSLHSTNPKCDTIQVKVTVFPNAKVRFEPQFPNDAVAYDSTKIDSLLQARLTNFPKINPALKRGIPVTTQFVLPVIIKQD
jgi:hypothetical protein